MNIDYNLIISYLWENITFELFLKFVIVYFFIIWVALIVWVIKDISNRTKSLILQLIAVLIIVLLTPFGLVIYLIIRPSKTLLEKYYEEIDDNLDTFEQVIEDKNCKEEENILCQKCHYPISHNFNFCPNCNIKLKSECLECGKIINTFWKNCPYCGVNNNFNIKDEVLIKKLNIENNTSETKKNVEDLILNEQEEFEKKIKS